MKNTPVVLGLVAVIILSFGFAGLTLQAHGQENNYFNRKWRAAFAAHPFLRQALSLHSDGDARADYLGQRYSKILIEVDSVRDTRVYLEALDGFVEKTKILTGKETGYLISDRQILYPQRAISEADLDRIVRQHRNHKSRGDTAMVYLLIAGQAADEPETLGSTFEEYGIILYADALEDFTRRSPDTLANYQLSSALHEFGHQLGLPHNTEPNCLMNEHAEESRVAREAPADVIADFCEFELGLLKN